MTNIETEADYLLKDQMFALRHRAFFERRNWDVKSHNNRENDDLDGPYTTYLIANHGSSVVGSLRLIETTRDYMLTRYFPELLGRDPAPKDPKTWECSRFCVDVRNSDVMSSAVTRCLLLEMFRLADRNGISTIIGVMDSLMERILRRQGCVGQSFGSRRAMPDGLVAMVKKFDVQQSLRALDQRNSDMRENARSHVKVAIR